MQFFTMATLFLATALAAPAQDSANAVERRASNPACPSNLLGLYSSPVCCKVDILGVANLDCQPPSKAPSNCNSFKSICASSGKQAQCCTIPIAGQGLVCKDPVGN